MEKDKVIIYGGSGFIGSHIAEIFKHENFEVIIVDRHEPRDNTLEYVEWDGMHEVPKDQLLLKPRAVINLIGRPIAGRWTRDIKQEIYDSRIRNTEFIVKSFENTLYRPDVFLNASAVGFYGDCAGEAVFENHSRGEGFLARVCEDWERTANKAESYGVRVAIMRQGTVIGREGGYLKALLPLLKLKMLFQFGPLYNSFSWVHVQDVARAYYFAATHTELQGPLNIVAPELITRMESFELIREIYKVAFSPYAPDAFMKILLRGAAEELAWSQKCVPQLLTRAHFNFLYPDFRSAVQETTFKT